MRLIILQAFGRLKSEPFEWPDEPPHIMFNCTPSRGKLKGWEIGKDIDMSSPTIRRAVFEHSGYYQMLPGSKLAAIYKLVDW